jgi:hypothetical protein
MKSDDYSLDEVCSNSGEGFASWGLNAGGNQA